MVDDPHDSPDEWRRRVEALRTIFVRFRERHYLSRADLQGMVQELVLLNKALIEALAELGTPPELEPAEGAAPDPGSGEDDTRR